jgi:hypothetical protein
VVGARTPRRQHQRTLSEALWQLAPVVAAILLLRLALDEVRRATDHSWWIERPGLVLLVASRCVTIWARIGLGRMWSSSPDIVRTDHELRTNGPLRDHAASHLHRPLRHARRNGALERLGRLSRLSHRRGRLPRSPDSDRGAGDEPGLFRTSTRATESGCRASCHASISAAGVDPAPAELERGRRGRSQFARSLRSSGSAPPHPQSGPLCVSSGYDVRRYG